MFELIEAENGRLIGPKTWDRIVGNYETQIGQSVNDHRPVRLLVYKLCYDLYCCLHMAGNRYGIGV